MTDNEIVKALECCVSEKEGCKGCPYEVDGCLLDGTNKLLKDIFALINRQKAEIAKLEKVEKYADETIKTQAAEIERYLHSIKLLEKDVQTAQSELKEFKAVYVDKIADMAIKEFAERLKSLQIGLEISSESLYYVPIDCIDNLVKEMTEDENENH